MKDCNFFTHKWGRWSAPFNGFDSNAYQQRRCLLCNRAHIKRVMGTSFATSRVPQRGPDENNDPSALPIGEAPHAD